jgi:hypothetical protein
LFQVAGNPQLSRCEVDALRATLSVGSGTNQSGANSGCTTCSGITCSAGAGSTDGQSGVFNGSAQLVNASDLAWMQNVVTLTGSLRLESTTLSNLNGLANLEEITGDLLLTSNPQLTNVNGLSGLETVGGSVNIQTNAALTNVNGLSSLTAVAGYFQINNCDALTNVGGLSSLQSVGQYANIEGCALLSNLDGLSNLASVGTTTAHYLRLYNNPQLASILGLIPSQGSLTNLSGNLTIQYNAPLSSCQATALQASLIGEGWNRTFTQNNNLTCATSCGGTNNTVCQ